MNLQAILDESYQAFMRELDHSKLILLHPEGRYRSMLVAHLLNSDDFNVFYYAIGPDDIDLRSFLTSLSNSLADQHVTFGRHINILPPSVYHNPMQHFDLVMDTFVKDLSEVSDTRFLLILDEYDLSDRADEVQLFVEHLSAIMPDHGHIVLNSRTLPRLPWVAMVSHSRATLLKDAELITENFHGTKQSKADNGLEVYALGPGFVVSNGEQISNWEGHLPRLLFFFALDRPIVTRSEICRAFWPDLDTDQAVNVFHVTKRRLHKALDTDVLVHDDGYYRVNPDIPIYYDTIEFADVLMAARTADNTDDKMAAWQRAADLYRGAFLHGHSDRWIDNRCEEFKAGYLEAVTSMAGVWNAEGRKELALTTLQKALDADPMNEAIHRDVVTLYNDLGRRGEAAEHYQQLVKSMQEADAHLSDETEAFFKEMLG